jgi:uncharacterized membrane protein YeaQ/YmgE (transglycosylase-associated protein family)
MALDAGSIITILIVGLIAGWIAGLIMRGGGFGIIGNLIVGVLGAIVGYFIFDALDITLGTGIIGAILTSSIGAIILLFIIGLVRG